MSTWMGVKTKRDIIGHEKYDRQEENYEHFITFLGSVGTQIANEIT